ncbi:MAG: ATP--guanido phosphotransferase [Clostridia bacterium]|nr:ATP--guanido phosphotransferase [Clostridia bacterium]
MIVPDLYTGNIIKSRVRLARNLEGYPFRVNDPVAAREIVKTVNRALVKCGTFNLYSMKTLNDLNAEALVERHLISPALKKNKECGAALISSDETVSVMVCEEDVLREQCFMKGFRLEEAYKVLNRIDDELEKHLDVAFSERFGYLTACTTNVGTGMRASVMMFLPGLTAGGKISMLDEEVKSYGLTIRGVYGEGSAAEGCVYQISNESTLGLSEYELIKSVENAVERICLTEREESETMFGGKNELKTIDASRKAYGILTNAFLLSYGDFLKYIAQVKLGAMLGMINIADVSEIDELIVSVRPANLCVSYGKKLSATDRDLFRAEMVSKKLTKLVE